MGQLQEKCADPSRANCASRMAVAFAVAALVACLVATLAGGDKLAWADDGTTDLAIAAPQQSSSALDSDSSLFIEREATGNGSAATGVLKAGDKLYAHAYDYWDDDVIEPQSHWEYQWFAGDSRTASTSTYEAIDGQTAQCLDITNDLAEQLAGKYIRVRLTVGSIVLEAPASVYSTPGPVELEGRVKLGWAFVLDSAAVIGNAGGMSSTSSANTGDTLKAVAMKEGAATTPLYTADGVTFTWQVADSADGPFSDTGVTGDSFAVTQDYEGKYLRVSANAGINTMETTSVRVYPAGQIELQSVDISDPGTIQLPGAGEDKIVLEATAYKGNNYSDRVAVTEGVTFEWSYATDKDAADGAWTVVEGVTGNELELDEAFAGCYVRVKATAGANTVTVRDSYIRGPFKTDGALIYSAVLTVNGESGYNVAVGDELGVIAYERTDAGGRGDAIASDRLTYRWQVAEAGADAYSDIASPAGVAATLAVDASYQGKTIRCIVNARAGDYTTRATNPVAAEGSVFVTTVSLSVGGVPTSSSTTIPLGSTIDAVVSNADSANLNDSSAITWSWYASAQRYASSVTESDRIDGATGASFTVDDPSYIGKYLYAFADGGYGAAKSSASGQIVGAHAVELWSVSVTGGIAGVVGVGDVVSASAKKIVSVPGTSTTYQADVAVDDAVSYQWQYASSSTTSDGAYTDIPGATGVSYAITSDMEGKYLRVVATSANTAVSTKSSTSSSAQTVSPIGPVQAKAGAMRLDAVEIVSSLANAMWVGATVTPTATYVPAGSYVSRPVPQDAQVTYAWKVADSAGGPFEAFDADAYPNSSVSPSGELVIGADLLGKYVRVEANAQINTVSSLNWQVLPEGVYDLMRITFGNNALYTEDTIVTALQAKTLDYANEYSFGITVPIDNPYVTYQWYSTSDEPTGADGQDFSGATWVPIEGATGADLVIPESVVGCYVKVVATSAKDGLSSSVERTSTTRVLSKKSLETAAARLDELLFHPHPSYGVRENVNDIVSARLEALGYYGITVKAKSWRASKPDEKAHLGISTADDETNGDVTFFSYDDALSSSTHSFTSERQVSITFELTRGAEAPVSYTATASIPWDRSAASALLNGVADELALGLAEGDSVDAVTSNITLPCKTGAVWVAWASSDPEVIAVTGDVSWEDFTGVVMRGTDDAEVTLTATLDGSIIDTWDDTIADLTLTKEFPVVVKGDAEMIAEMNEELSAVLNASFVESNLTYSLTGADVDTSAVIGDIQLPQTRTLFAGGDLSSRDYQVTYSSDDESIIKVNGYRAKVFRPLPGESAVPVRITLTASSRSIPGVTFSKSIELLTSPVTEDEIDEDIGFMEQVKAAVFEGYSEGLQDQSAVTSSLHPFQRAYFTDEGALHWKYAYNDNSDAACAIGFSPQTVADNPSSDASYSNFVSSHPGLIADSSLNLVGRATRDIDVTITCCLSSDRFGDYYERYAGDASCPDGLKDKFRQLYRQKVPCQITVKGTQVSTAARDELIAAADEAEAALAGVSVSADGSDVPESGMWVDAATMEQLEDAIVLARAEAVKDNVTDVEIESARSGLQAALNAFNEAVKPGTQVNSSAGEELKRNLMAVAEEAEALLNTVYTSVDGSDVAVGRKWADAEAIDKFESAIEEVRALAMSENVSESDALQAIGKLALARVAFVNAMHDGSQASSASSESSSGAAAGNGAAVGSSSVAGSGSSKAVYRVTAAVRTGQGEVWYDACRAPKSAKSVVVPATVRIGKATYRVVGVSSGAFKNMKKLKTVTFGVNVSKVSKSAFKKTPKLKKLVVKGVALCKKANVKGALKGSKAGKIKVKVPKKAKKAAKKAFTKKNLGASKAVKVK